MLPLYILSTGKPKGVVVTHKNVLASTTIVGDIVVESDFIVCYLPLAHIFELVSEISCIGAGASLCYADPKTLTQTGAYPIGALEQYKPTLMVGVPKIWDVIKKGVQAKIGGESKVKQFLVNTAFEIRMRARKLGFDTPLFKALVFKKFAKVVGGRLRLAISGGGPLNSDVQEFISTCFGIPMGQGYGLTETCAALTIQDVVTDGTASLCCSFPISRSSSIKVSVGRNFRFLLSTVIVSRDEWAFICKGKNSPRHVAPAEKPFLTAPNFFG